MRKKHFFCENLLIVCLCISICFSGLVLEIYILMASNFKNTITCVGMLFVLWGGYIVVWMKLKKQGFGAKIISPYVIKSNYEDFKQVLERMELIFDSYKKCCLLDGQIVYFANKRVKRLEIRNFVFKFDLLNYKEFIQLGRSATKAIKKSLSDESESSITSNWKKVRLNIVVVKKINDDAELLVNQNANLLFGRHEPILNVVYDISKKNVIIPAHFGLTNYLIYNKLYCILNKCFRQ